MSLTTVAQRIIATQGEFALQDLAAIVPERLYTTLRTKEKELLVQLWTAMTPEEQTEVSALVSEEFNPEEIKQELDQVLPELRQNAQEAEAVMKKVTGVEHEKARFLYNDITAQLREAEERRLLLDTYEKEATAWKL